MNLLLTILMIIGSVILVLLAILLLLLLLLLFVPFRYQLDGQKQEAQIRGSGTVSYLFRAVRATVSIEASSDGIQTKRADLILFGISLQEHRRMKRERANAKRFAKKRKRLEQLRQEDPARYHALKEEAQKRRAQAAATSPTLPEVTAPSEESIETIEAAKPTETAKAIEAPTAAKSPETAEMQHTTTRNHPFLRLIARLLRALIRLSGIMTERLHQGLTNLILLPIRLISRLYALFDRLLQIRETIGRAVTMLQDPRFQAAVRLALADLKKLLKHIRPKQLRGHIDYGLSDPALTGQLLGAASLLKAVYGAELQLNPDFDAEKTTVNGELHIAGRIYLFYILWTGITLLLNKNIRCVISWIRNRGNKEEHDNG